jgi:hypothetical protein
MNIEEISKMIEFAMKIINALPEDRLRRTYSDEIDTAIKNYNTEVGMLKIAIEKHFEKEKKEGTPPNLSLRRAYQNLKFL